MNRRTPRRLRPEERELWDRVRQTAAPMHPDKNKILHDAVERMKPAAPPRESSHFRLGETAPFLPPGNDLAASVSDRLADAAVRMDRKRFGRMQRGKLKPERRIDLHGMTMNRAHPALMRFIQDAHADGVRLVLVITGKGRDTDRGGPIPVPRGVLKHQVPLWLQSPALAALVIQVSEAHLKHGGSGAYYVYLRNNR